MSNPVLDVNLYISTQCPHCAQALELLTKAVKQGTIGSLNITNLSTINNIEEYAHIRSIPFIQLQDFEFSGSISQLEIDAWAKAHKEGALATYYFSSLLMDGQLTKAELLIKKKPAYWFELINMAKNEETKMQVRIGITAIFETLNTEILQTAQCDKIIAALIKACNINNSAIRVDLIYLSSLLYISLKERKQNNKNLTRFINSLCNDPSDEVKEIIEDSLA